MPILVNNVTAQILDNFTGSLYFFSNLSGEVQFEDYINLNGFIAYIQNFTEVGHVQYLQKPQLFGLKNQYNVPIVTLEISY